MSEDEQESENQNPVEIDEVFWREFFMLLEISKHDGIEKRLV